MKTVEKILGLVSVIIILIGLYTRFPFMALAITLSLTLLSLIYLVFSFALLNDIRFRNIFKSNSFKGISRLRIIGTILTGFVFSIVCIAILFKFQLWPHANFNLSFGLVCMAIILIVAEIKFYQTKDKFYKRILFRTLIIGVVGLIFYSLTYENILEIKYRDYPEFIEAEKKSMQDPENKELQQKATEERQKMYNN